VPTRRQTADDACPGALRLHAAADGPLARVRLPGGMLTGRQLRVLAEIAEQHGDGALELTSRANIQLRALRADPGELAGRLAGAGLLPSLAHETVRNIAAPPLADAETRGLVEALDRGLCADFELAALPGRFLFAIGRTSLSADVAAVRAGGEWAVLLGGSDVGVRVPTGRVVETMLGAARGFLAERGGREPRPWRLREIPGGPELVAARMAGARPGAELGATQQPGTKLGGAQQLETQPETEPDAAQQPETQPETEPDAAQRPGTELGVREPGAERMVGKLVRPDAERAAVGVLVPLGRLTRVHLEVLARAERLAVTPGGGVVVLDLVPEAADRWVRELRDAGLVTDGDSKWVGVTTCAGRPGCAKALADVRADAEAAARFVDGRPVHWVGCERGCGSPAAPHVRVEATRGGYLVDGESVEGDLGEVVAARRA
jgi:precorrin-3B synthase